VINQYPRREWATFVSATVAKGVDVTTNIGDPDWQSINLNVSHLTW